MSLGMLGGYGSDSGSDIISDSEDKTGTSGTFHTSSVLEQFSEEDNDPSCIDPLNLHSGGHTDNEDSTSESGSSAPPSPAGRQDNPASLPLPDIDRIVARNASYSGSELLGRSDTINCSDQATCTEGGSTEESSVFFNPYKKAEEDRLAILKRHVSEFDKKPEVKAKKVASLAWEKNFHIMSPDAARDRSSRSRAEIPPPVTYTKHTQGSQGTSGPLARDISSTPPSVPPPAVVHTWPGRVPAHGYQQQVVVKQRGQQPSGEELFDDKDSSILVKKPRKHRSGVSDSLTPPKKFMKMHRQIQAKERPWTVDS